MIDVVNGRALLQQALQGRTIFGHGDIEHCNMVTGTGLHTLQQGNIPFNARDPLRRQRVFESQLQQ